MKVSLFHAAESEELLAVKRLKLDYEDLVSVSADLQRRWEALLEAVNPFIVLLTHVQRFTLDILLMLPVSVTSVTEPKLFLSAPAYTPAPVNKFHFLKCWMFSFGLKPFPVT